MKRDSSSTTLWKKSLEETATAATATTDQAEREATHMCDTQQAHLERCSYDYRVKWLIGLGKEGGGAEQKSSARARVCVRRRQEAGVDTTWSERQGMEGDGGENLTTAGLLFRLHIVIFHDDARAWPTDGPR